MLVAEVGVNGDDNRLFKVTYDGTLYDERGVSAVGGKAEQLTEALRQGWSEGLTLEAAVALGKSAFRTSEGRDPEGWEAAVLDRNNGRRTFRRLTADQLA